MNPPSPPLDPIYTDAEREELACLRYFLAELDKLRERGLVPEETHAVVAAEKTARREAIERHGRGEAALRQARKLATTDLKAAADWAARAAEADPDRTEARELAESLQARLVEAEASRDRLQEARDALQAGDDAAVLRLAGEILAAQPDHLDASVLRAFALQRQERLDEALDAYRRVKSLQPGNAVWDRWIADVDRRRWATRPAAAVDLAVEPAAKPKPTVKPAPEPVPVVPAEPRLSVGTIAAEFLQDHWQKLILCLAVLLIVVSSNVGAYQVLGPRIWSPVGKCALALVYTSMFAGLGAGLVRWGAERAGRIMLLTTLIVVPANFMLAGQVGLLAEPSPGRIALMAVDAAALFGLMQLVARSLRLPSGSGLLPMSLFAIGAFNAAPTGSAAWPWAWQYAAFLAPGFVTLASVGRLVSTFASEKDGSRRDVFYAALALFGFAFVTGAVRTGLFVLQLHPALFAVPAMTTALAAVVASRGARRIDDDARHAAWMRFSGLALSGAAFALALTRPGRSAEYGVNDLAVAGMGLVLYVALLHVTRLPAFLYMALGAVALAGLGVHDLALGGFEAFERAVAAALGYPGALPAPFRAAGGLVANVLLAGLAIGFRRGWRDERLARHCHYIGVPLSVAACGFSLFEPRAARYVLTGYSALYTSAVVVFAAPRVIYLACAATAGALYFALDFWPGATLAERGLVWASLGLAYWGLAAVLKLRGTDAAYRRPLDHAALATAALALFAATLSVVQPPGVATYGAAGAFGLVGLLAVLVNRDEPSRALGYVAVVAVQVGLVVLSIRAGRHWVEALSSGQFAVVLGTIGLTSTGLGRGLGRREGSERIAVFPRPLTQTALMLALLAVVFCGIDLARRELHPVRADLLTLALAMGLAGTTLTTLLPVYPLVILAHAAIGCGLGVWAALVQAGHGVPYETAAMHAALMLGYALLLIPLEEALRRRLHAHPLNNTSPLVSLRFARALPTFEVGVIGVAVVATLVGLENGRAVVFTYAAGALALFWSTRLRREPMLVHLGLALTTAAAGCLTALRIGWADEGVTTAWLALTAAGLAGAYGLAAWLARRRGEETLYANPCLRSAGLLTFGVLFAAVVGRLISAKSYQIGATACGLNAAALIGLTFLKPRARLSYRSLLSIVGAVYIVLFSVGQARPDTAHVPGLVAVVLGLIFDAVGLALTRLATPENGRDWLYRRPLFRTALTLTVLAVPAAYWSSLTMLLVGLSCLVLVKALPSRNWLYGTIAALAWAAYNQWFTAWPADRAAWLGVAAAYAAWLVGLGVRKAEPGLVRRLKLIDRGYDVPLFHSAVVAALAALGWRSFEHLTGPLPLSWSAGLVASLAPFGLLMIKASPSRAWMHAALGLANLAVGLWIYPRFVSELWWLTIAEGLALLWQVVHRDLRVREFALCRLAGVPDLGYSRAIRTWSLGLFAAGTAGAASVVVGMVAATLGEVTPLHDAGLYPWLAVLAALGLAAAYAAFAWGGDHPAESVMGGAVVATLLAWWLFDPSSPVMTRWPIPGVGAIPAATAFLAGLLILACLRLINRPGAATFWGREIGDDPGARLDAFLRQYGLGLAALAVVMTRAQAGPWTVAALAIAALASGGLAVARDGIGAGYLSGLTLAAAGGFAAEAAARRMNVTVELDVFMYSLGGLVLTLGLLWRLAGAVRREPYEAEAYRAAVLPARSVGLAWEHVVLLGAVVAWSAVIATMFGWKQPTTRGAMVAVGELFAVALLAVGLVVRWRSTALVYAAQAATMSAYLYYRWIFPLPATTDAVVLTLFGYLDLGLAEALQRAGLGRFAKATRYASLVMPIVPLALLLTGDPLTERTLFILMACATFYGVACYQLQWRSLGYSAAVLYNAFLWLLWGRLGWTMTDHVPFFLVPVGLSAVLFAEANRRDLGRQAVNAIRGVGLSVVYLSLAAPIWQFQSLGAWAALLALSLVGIFVGIGLRIQIFLWMGLAGFLLDVLYQLGRVGRESALATSAIMLAVGLGLVAFAAFNEKRGIAAKLRSMYDEARAWE